MKHALKERGGGQRGRYYQFVDDDKDLKLIGMSWKEVDRSDFAPSLEINKHKYTIKTHYTKPLIYNRTGNICH